MPKITYLQSNGEALQVDAELGSSLMHAAVAGGVAGIDAECGGNGMCATCHVYINPEQLQQLTEMDDNEDQMLDCTASPRQANSRLSCQLEITETMDGLNVTLPDRQA